MAKIAILGYGTVGSGVFDIFNQTDFTKKVGEDISVKRILDIRDFPDHPQKDLFTKNFDEIVSDDEISVVAETMGGLHPAYEFTKALLECGKSVTTSNKELVATYGPELLRLASKNNVRYLFEASVGGGIPIIRPLSSCLLANKVEKIAGILNATTNFILTQMIEEGREFDAALKEAQQRGYAERNPAADIEGYDACRKIAILSSMATGEFVDYNDIPTEGITSITLKDVKYAAMLGYAIKLVGYSKQTENGELYACVAPMLIRNSCPLAGVRDVFNAIMVTGNYLGDAMFYGRGAGKEETASAVSADVIDIVKTKVSQTPLFWEENKIKMMNPEDKRWQFFVRTAENTDKISELFGNVSLVTDETDSEVAFITEVMTEKEFREKIACLDGSSIKVLTLDD